MIDNLIIGDRQTGKTSKLIRISAAEGRYIVVPTEGMKRSVARQAREMGLNIPYPVCSAELPFHVRFHSSVLVDEAQMLLETIIGAPISAMTVCARDPAHERTCHMSDGYCSVCGRPDPSGGDARYCAYCGARVVDE